MFLESLLVEKFTWEALPTHTQTKNDSAYFSDQKILGIFRNVFQKGPGKGGALEKSPASIGSLQSNQTSNYIKKNANVEITPKECTLEKLHSFPSRKSQAMRRNPVRSSLTCSPHLSMKTASVMLDFFIWYLNQTIELRLPRIENSQMGRSELDVQWVSMTPTSRRKKLILVTSSFWSCRFSSSEERIIEDQRDCKQ